MVTLNDDVRLHLLLSLPKPELLKMCRANSTFFLTCKHHKNVLCNRFLQEEYSFPRDHRNDPCYIYDFLLNYKRFAVVRYFDSTTIRDIEHIDSTSSKEAAIQQCTHAAPPTATTSITPRTPAPQHAVYVVTTRSRDGIDQFAYAVVDTEPDMPTSSDPDTCRQLCSDLFGLQDISPCSLYVFLRKFRKYLFFTFDSDAGQLHVSSTGDTGGFKAFKHPRAWGIRFPTRTALIKGNMATNVSFVVDTTSPPYTPEQQSAERPAPQHVRSRTIAEAIGELGLEPPSRHHSKTNYYVLLLEQNNRSRRPFYTFINVTLNKRAIRKINFVIPVCRSDTFDIHTRLFFPEDTVRALSNVVSPFFHQPQVIERFHRVFNDVLDTNACDDMEALLHFYNLQGFIQE